MDNVSLLYPRIAAGVATLGAMFNIILAVSNVAHLSSLPPSSFLVFWLSVFDNFMLIGSLIVTLPVIFNTDNTITAVSNTTTFTETPVSCQVRGILELTGGLSTICICSGLTYLRYSVIVLKRTPPRLFVVKFVAVASCTMFLVAVFPAVAGNSGIIFVLRSSGLCCNVGWDRVPQYSAVCLAVLSVPLSSIGYAYGRVFLEMRRVQLEVSALSANSTGLEIGIQARTFQASGKLLDEKQRQLLIQTIIIVVTFLIGWFPYAVMVVTEATTREPVSPTFDFLATVFVFIMSTTNPVIVFSFDKPIRENILQFWCFSRLPGNPSALEKTSEAETK